MLFKANPSKIAYTPLLIILVAISYFILGFLGLQLAVPPSQAGAIWPPSGVALAFGLIFGYSVLPGIFIGNFCISAWAFGFSDDSWIIYCATGLGATLNTALAVKLIRLYVRQPLELIDDKDIFSFLFIGGPLCCLIPASVGIGSMFLADMIGSSEVFINWVTWWVGDSIGVVIFSPILISFFHPNSPIWRRRRVTLTFPLLITFSLILSFFIYVQKLDLNRRQQQFVDQSKQITQAINSRLQNHLWNIQSIHSFYISTEFIDENEFHLFTDSALIQFSELQLIRWIQYQDAKLQPLYHTSKENSQVSIDYLPKKLLESFSKKLVLSSTLFHLRPDHNILELYIPVYKNLENNAFQLFGVISLSLDIDKLISDIINNQRHNLISLKVTNSQTGVILYNREKSHQNNFVRHYSLNLGNQNWLASFSFINTTDNQTHWSMWWLLISGFLFTSLLGTGLLLLTGRYFETETIIRKRTNELVTAKNNAEAASQAKSRFLSNISHELRTPLNGLLGFAQLLKTKEEQSEQDRKYIGIIEQCGHDLLALINDLLDISRIESNKINISYNNINLDDFLDDIISLFDLKATEKSLTFIVKKNQHADNIKTDEKRLKQIIVNLLNNAVKFTNAGHIILTISNDDKYLCFEIVDSGCGISKHNLDIIFSPFVQIDEGDFSRDGVGLGLAITQELIRLLNGTITVSSELEWGTTFTVKIPLIAQPKTAPKLENDIPALNSNTFNCRVLVVDDNEINMLLFCDILNRLNCQYDTAVDGRQALTLLQQNIYDLALIDLNMPVMSGIELIGHIKEEKMSLKTIAVSAFAEEDKINQAIKAGFDLYLTKPFKIEDIKEIIDDLANEKT